MSIARRFSRLAAAAAAGACLALATGCLAVQQAPVVPPQGFLFQDVSAPITTEFKATPVGAANTKVGSASTRYLDFSLILFGLNFGWDDVAVEEIARRNGIQQVSYAEYRHFSILGFYREFTVTVHGN